MLPDEERNALIFRTNSSMFSPGAAGGISGVVEETFSGAGDAGRGLLTTAAGEGFRGECAGVTMSENKNSGNINQTQQGWKGDEKWPGAERFKNGNTFNEEEEIPLCAESCYLD